MQITAHTVREQLVLAPDTDRLDTASAQAFLRASTDTLGDARHVVLDLCGVQFIDSTGLGALVALRRALGDDGRLRLVSANPRVRLLLEMTRLSAVLPLFATTQEALAA